MTAPAAAAPAKPGRVYYVAKKLDPQTGAFTKYVSAGWVRIVTVKR